MTGSRYGAYVEKLKASVTQSAGTLSPDVRTAIVTRDRSRIPPALVPYLEKVWAHANRITDDDVEQLKHAGFSEDEIFEATAAAAVGAALMRLERGMGALRA